MTTEKIEEILKKHLHWILEDCEGWEGMRANLSGANLSGAKNIPYIPITCPDAGAFIAWKKVNGYIVKL